MSYAEDTKVPFEQSVAEIVRLVKKAGAAQIGQIESRDKLVIAFTLADRQMKFVLPLVTEYKGPAFHGNGRAVDAAKVIEQRNRSKARALLLVIKAKLESVESGIETFEEAFLAHIVTASGETVYERISAPLAIEYDTGKVSGVAGLLGGPKA